MYNIGIHGVEGLCEIALMMKWDGARFQSKE